MVTPALASSLLQQSMPTLKQMKFSMMGAELLQ